MLGAKRAVFISPRKKFYNPTQRLEASPSRTRELKKIRAKQAVGSRQALTKSDKKAGFNPR